MKTTTSSTPIAPHQRRENTALSLEHGTPNEALQEATLGKSDERIGIQIALRQLCSSAATFVSKLSTREIATLLKAQLKPANPLEPEDENPTEQEKAAQSTEQEKQRSMMDLLHDTMNAGFHALRVVTRLFGTRTSVVVIRRAPMHGDLQDPLAPSGDTHAQYAPVVAALLSDLSSPDDRGSKAMVVALEQVAAEVRREKNEERIQEKKREEDEKHRTLVHARDAIHARDLQNGTRNPATEEIIQQLEGPYAISLETALARIDELNRTEKV